MDEIRSLYGDAGIFAYYNRKDIATSNNAILTCYTEHVENQKKPNRYFQVDLTPMELFKRVTSIPIKNRSFFEVILGERKQKPHFDIDMEIGKEKKYHHTTRIINDEHELETASQEVINELCNILCKYVTRDDIQIYTSHGNTKRSFHVIINKWYCTDNHHAKELYYHVTSHMTPTNACFLDDMVYSVIQQFRLLGSCKVNQPKRMKIKINQPCDLTYEDLKTSLISHIPNTAVLMPRFETSLPERVVSNECIPDDIVDAALELMSINKHLDPKHARFDKMVNNYVILRRTRDSYCNKCNIIHDSNNPYLTIVGVSDTHWRVYYSCRKSKAWLLGDVYLEDEVPPDSTQENTTNVEPKKPVQKIINIKQHLEQFKLKIQEDVIIGNTEHIGYIDE